MNHTLLDNEVVLRPRFTLQEEEDKEVVLNKFKEAKDSDMTINCLDNHVFIKFKKEKQDFWSPQLHLEIDDTYGPTEVFGRFGPNPSLWTMFMFLHFVIGSLFIIGSIWAYVNHDLGKPYGLQLLLMGIMVLFWITFYIFGQLGKKKGAPQMRRLYAFTIGVLHDKR